MTLSHYLRRIRSAFAVFILVTLPGCFLFPGSGGDGDEEDTYSASAGAVAPSFYTGYGGSYSAPYSAGSGGGYSEDVWRCGETPTSCSCSTGSGVISTSSSCEYEWDCCLLTGDTQCECFTANGSCEAEAASRPDAVVVLRCPPVAPPPVSAACAAEAENCRLSYLNENGLQGCCDGLVCKPNPQGIPVCQPGTEEEIALARLCMDVRSEELTFEQQLVSEAGEIGFDTVDSTTSVSFGPDGCISGIDLWLSQSGSVYCSLQAITGPLADDTGALVITNFFLSLGMGSLPCPGVIPEGYSGEIYGLFSNVEGFSATIAFQGLTCEVDSFDDYCLAGNIELRLNGTLSGLSSSLSLNNAVLVLSGRICGYSSSSAVCPTAP